MCWWCKQQKWKKNRNPKSSFQSILFLFFIVIKYLESNRNSEMDQRYFQVIIVALPLMHFLNGSHCVHNLREFLGISNVLQYRSVFYELSDIYICMCRLHIFFTDTHFIVKTTHLHRLHWRSFETSITANYPLGWEDWRFVSRFLDYRPIIKGSNKFIPLIKEFLTFWKVHHDCSCE